MLSAVPAMHQLPLPGQRSIEPVTCSFCNNL